MFAYSFDESVIVAITTCRGASQKGKLPPVDSWEPFVSELGTPKVGMFYTFDLKQTRKFLLESGRNPKITLKNG